MKVKKLICIVTILTVFILSGSAEPGSAEPKDYANYKDWQMDNEKSSLLEEWRNLELNYSSLSAEEYRDKVTALQKVFKEQISIQDTFEFEDSKAEASKELLSAIDLLEQSITNGSVQEINNARTMTNLAIINFMNLQVNIMKNSMSIVFFLFASILIVLLLFIFTTAFFAIRLKRSRKIELETSSFSKKIMEVQEKERKRLSLELHDTIAQDLRAVQLLTVKAFSPDTDASEIEAIKKQVLETESKSILDIRTMCYNLTPPDLDRKDLKSALSHYCSTFKRDTGIDCSLVITEECDFSGFSGENQLDIFRLVQEALTNVAKHSQAEEATVVLRTKKSEEDTSLLVIITDDGKGFNLESASFLDSHFGLKGMKQRTRFLGGMLKIKTAPGEGTEVQVEIPVKREAGR